MNHYNGNNVLIGSLILVTLIILVALTSCVAPTKKADSVDPIRNAGDIGRALNCVMAPSACKSTEQKQKEEQEFIQEFKRVDEEKSQSTAK